VIKKNGFEVGVDVFENFLNSVAASNAGDLAFLVEKKNSPTASVSVPGSRQTSRTDRCSASRSVQEADKAIAATFGDEVRLLPKLEEGRPRCGFG
jgi:hypothetical protein